jgi:hypothetical protein
MSLSQGTAQAAGKTAWVAWPRTWPDKRGNFLKWRWQPPPTRANDAVSVERGQSMSQASDEMLLTIFLKHRQSMNLGEINRKLDETGFWKKFPPEGTEVVSWYVLMGIGQVVTLKLPTEKLRAVNLAVEQNGWGAFETEFYATYDFEPIRQGLRARAQGGGT